MYISALIQLIPFHQTNVHIPFHDFRIRANLETKWTLYQMKYYQMKW